MLFAIDAADNLGNSGEDTQVLLMDENGNLLAAWIHGKDPYFALKASRKSLCWLRSMTKVYIVELEDGSKVAHLAGRYCYDLAMAANDGAAGLARMPLLIRLTAHGLAWSKQTRIGPPSKSDGFWSKGRRRSGIAACATYGGNDVEADERHHCFVADWRRLRGWNGYRFAEGGSNTAPLSANNQAAPQPKGTDEIPR
jgi:hypothetical protein